MINTIDSFISDEEEEFCPLCVEEMDISDKNFKPCPCGYQVCQFCYNNIRQNPELNGKCPGCRRLYDDETVEYKIVSQEEWKVEQSKQSKKDREKKQKEKEKKEHEQASRKHLAGMRVIQKNLVYVVGLNPEVEHDELHSVLRSEKYFGQYGKILKIVINRRNPPTTSSSGLHYASNHHNGFGVYVTFSKKEEATRCINAIDGTYIDGRPLKAAYGTTKYCSSYLRGQPCPNPNCMFLHEPGEEADSYTRQDLSTRQNLKLNNEAFKGSPVPRHANNSQYFNHHHNDQDHFVNSGSGGTSPSANIAVTVPSQHQPIVGAAPLPAAASWATSATTPKVAPASLNTTVFANSSAFPTLAESTTLQQQQQQHHQQQQQQQRKNKQINQFSDEYNPEATANAIIDETLNLLNSLTSIDYKLKANVFTDDTLSGINSVFTFGQFNFSNKVDSSLNLKLVKSLIPKLHTNEDNELIAELQRFAEQNAQPTTADIGQQPQQQLLGQPQAQAQQFYNQQNTAAQALLQQQVLQAQQQQLQQQQQNQNAFQNQHFGQRQAQPQLQDSHVQQLLHERLLQQQQQQQKGGDANILFNKLKNDRSFASTPPPPGLFNTSTANNSSGPAPPVTGAASELLSHLMNGKKISA